MSLWDFLRTNILGSSLVIPNTNDLWKIFKFEARNRFTFLLYLLFILGFIAFSAWIAYCNSKKMYLLFTIGFLFVFCAFILQKITIINLENQHNKSQLTNNSTKNENRLISSLKRIITRTNNLYKQAEHFIGFEKRSFLENNIYVKHRHSNRKVHRQSHHTRHRADLVSNVVMCVSTKEKSLNTNNPECNEELNRAQRKDLSLKYVTRLHEVFLEHKKGSIEQTKFINKLSQLEVRTKDHLSKFKASFDNFMSTGREIESEMLGFNAPIRFLTTEYETLLNEIQKYFTIIRNFEDDKPNLVPIMYLENILKTRKVLEDTNENNIIDTRNISRHNRYIKILVITLIVVLIVVFMILILDISSMMIFIIPVISIICCILLITSIFILLSAHILDRNCKTGTVKDCNFDIMQADDYIKNIRRTEFVKQSELFRDDLDSSLRVSEKRTKALLDYTSLLMKDRLREEINVFLNLFDKIIFVNEHFNELTGNKIDSDAFYADINKMIKILEKFRDIFSQELKDEVLRMLIDEYKFCFFIKQEKNEIVSRTRSIMLGNPHRKSNHKIKNCLSILEELCRSRDRLDIIFNSIVIFVPILTISLLF